MCYWGNPIPDHIQPTYSTSVNDNKWFWIVFQSNPLIFPILNLSNFETFLVKKKKKKKIQFIRSILDYNLVSLHINILLSIISFWHFFFFASISYLSVFSRSDRISVKFHLLYEVFHLIERKDFVESSLRLSYDFSKY